MAIAATIGTVILSLAFVGAATNDTAQAVSLKLVLLVAFTAALPVGCGMVAVRQFKKLRKALRSR